MASASGFEALLGLSSVREHRFTRFRSGRLELVYRQRLNAWHIRWFDDNAREGASVPGMVLAVVREHPDGWHIDVRRNALALYDGPESFWRFCDQALAFLHARGQAVA